MFNALVVEKDEDGKTSASVQEIGAEQLPEGDVTVSVEYSTVNYKDGLCIGPGGGLVRNYPHVPGIDFAGTVEASDDDRYKAGARRFPMLVPSTPDDPAAVPNRAAWEVLMALKTPVLTTFGADDKVMAGVERVFQKLMPGATGQEHVVLPEAGHFLQEDVGPELARRINAFIAATG